MRAFVYNAQPSRVVFRAGALDDLDVAPRVRIGELDEQGLEPAQDDREEVVRERLKAYETQTTPVLQYFRQGGYPCWEIEGEAGGGPPAIARRIQELVAEKLGGPAGIRA